MFVTELTNPFGLEQVLGGIGVCQAVLRPLSHVIVDMNTCTVVS